VTEQPIRVLVELAVERTEITNGIAGSTSRKDPTRLDLDHKLTALESRIEEQVKAALPTTIGSRSVRHSGWTRILLEDATPMVWVRRTPRVSRGARAKQ